MKALTVRQPWASAIAYGPKRVENRTWPAPQWVIGSTIAIHAGKGIEWQARDQGWTAAGLTPPPHLRRFDRGAWTGSLPLGAVVAVATVHGCHWYGDCWSTGTVAPEGTMCSPWAIEAQHHWVLTDVRPLAEPVACNGAQSLWPLPPNVEAAVRAQAGDEAIRD